MSAISVCNSLFGHRERDAPSIEEIFAMSDDQLFSKINSNSLHILQQFMPDRPSLNYSLRARPHNKTLIAKTTQLIVNIIKKMMNE